MSGYTPWMKPREKFIRFLLTLGLMVLAFIVSFVFDEYHGFGWFGVLIFLIGAVMGGLAIHLFKGLKN